MFYISLMVTTAKPMVGMIKIKRKESRHTTVENSQITKEKSKKEKKEKE